MLNVLWLIGVLYANMWGQSAPTANTEKGLLGGAAVGTGIGALTGQGKPAVRAIGGETQSAQRVIACWDARVHYCEDVLQPRNKVSVLKGSVYLLCGKTNQTVCADGRVCVEACDPDGRTLVQWGFDAASLKKYKRTDLIGVGYTLRLPLDQTGLAEKELRLKVTYHANDGKTYFDEPTRVTLNHEAPPIVQAVHREPLAPAPILPMPRQTDCAIAGQVQLKVTLAQIHTVALKHLQARTPYSEGNFAFGVIQNSDGVVASLETLRSLGFVKMLAQPNIVTLNGRPASFVCGGETPAIVLTSNGSTTSFKRVGIRFDMLPAITTTDKIRLEVRSEVSGFKKPDVGPTPNFSTDVAKVAAELKDGQTLILLGSNAAPQAENHRIVLLVTPHWSSSPQATVASKNTRQTSFTDIVNMAKRGISDEIIIRQMEGTESIYDLTAEQIISLHESSVSNAVIRAMQDRRQNLVGTPQPWTKR